MDTLNIEKYGFNHTGNIFRNNPPGLTHSVKPH